MKIENDIKLDLVMYLSDSKGHLIITFSSNT